MFGRFFCIHSLTLLNPPPPLRYLLPHHLALYLLSHTQSASSTFLILILRHENLLTTSNDCLLNKFYTLQLLNICCKSVTIPLCICGRTICHLNHVRAAHHASKVTSTIHRSYTTFVPVVIQNPKFHSKRPPRTSFCERRF